MALYQETLNELELICEKVLGLDPMIRFVGIISDKGRLLEGRIKEGIEFHVNEKDRQMLFMGLALKERMRRDYDEQLGPVDYTISQRAKCVIMGFPFGEYIMYVSGEKNLDLATVAPRILEFIKQESILI